MTADRAGGSSFGERNFGAAMLGDARRTARLVAVADAVVRHTGGTWPDRLNQPRELKAFYRLMDCETVTHQAVLAPAIARTMERACAEPGVVLFLHDSTVLDYSGLSVEGLGQVGNGRGRGYYCHNSLAVKADTQEVLGLAHQILFCRPHVPKGEKKSERAARATRESRLWKRASQAIPSAPRGRLWVDIADRGADLTEFLDFEEQRGKKFVVRSQHNRRLLWENAGETQRVKLHDLLRSLPAQGRRAVSVAACAGRAAREAAVSLAWGQVTVLPPRQPRGEERGVPLPMWGVHVREIEPPAGVEPLEWFLLTNVSVACFEEACERVDWYACRWVVEEYHKGQKTGCHVEDMQFTTADRLEPAIALLSVAAVFLLNLRDASREPDACQREARTIVPLKFVEALSAWRHGAPRPDFSVHDFFYALGRLGGHQNRKHDRPPGWLVLWRGWTKLQLLVEGSETNPAKRYG
jgi:hypothetical protein